MTTESAARPRRLEPAQYARALSEIVRLSARTSPLAVTMKIVGSIVAAALPLVTTFFAALTTTALAAGAQTPGASVRIVLFAGLCRFGLSRTTEVDDTGAATLDLIMLAVTEGS